MKQIIKSVIQVIQDIQQLIIARLKVDRSIAKQVKLIMILDFWILIHTNMYIVPNTWEKWMILKERGRGVEIFKKIYTPSSTCKFNKL